MKQRKPANDELHRQLADALKAELEHFQKERADRLQTNREADVAREKE